MHAQFEQLLKQGMCTSKIMFLPPKRFMVIKLTFKRSCHSKSPEMTECDRSFMIHCYCPIQNYMCILYVFYTIQQYINQMFDGVPIKNQQQP